MQTICWDEWKHVIVMVAVDIVFAAMNSLIKAVIDAGMDRLLLITLRQLVATLFMAPIAYFKERKNRAELTAKIFVYLFFSAILGASLTQYLFFVGLQYTSATFACAFLNIAPVMTFLIALPFGSERLNVKSKAGMAKVMGTVVSVTGAMLLTLYKGVVLTNSSHKSMTSEQHGGHNEDHGTGRWMTGSIALIAGTVCWSSWFLLQSKVGKKYPALYSGTAIIFFLSFLQAAALSLATQRGVSSMSLWALRKKVVIITVLFSGIVGSGLGFLAMSWCVEKRGPVFTAAFSPLIQIIVAVIDFSILHESLCLGSVIGSILVIAGLYFLLWGKNEEARNCASKLVEEDGEGKGQLQTVGDQV